MRFPRSQQTEENEAGKFVADELENEENAVRKVINSFQCAHYKKNIVQDGDEFVIYYWALGNWDSLFLCSFTVGKKNESTTSSKSELKKVENVIKSIKIL